MGEAGRISAARGRGGSSIKPRRGGSSPRVMAGGPSMIMLIHRIWMAVNGAGRSMSWVARTLNTAPMLVESWKCTKRTMLS